MKLHFPLFKTSMNVLVEDSPPTQERRRRTLRNNRLGKKGVQETAPAADEKKPAEASVDPAKTSQTKDTPLKEDLKEPLLMVEVENVVHKKFRQTEEVKAVTQEIIKTIRDIISLNPLYRDTLQQMMHQGQRVVDNPVYLSDLGASLTAAEAHELQEVLEEMDVC